MTDRARQLFATLLVACAVLLAGMDRLHAQPPGNAQTRAEAQAAIAQLRSPYCPGLMLESCPSSLAGLLRDSIYDLAAQGASTEELVEWMLARHGEEYRGVPQGEGAGLVAWIMPPLAVLAAVGLLMLWFRSSRRPASPANVEAPPPLSDADRHELTEALRAWESSGDHGR